MVADLFQRHDHPVSILPGVLVCELRAGHGQDPAQLEACACLAPAVVDPLRFHDRVPAHAFGASKLARFHERHPQQRQQRHTLGVSGREQRDRPLEQVGRRPQVGSLFCAPPRRGQAGGGPARKLLVGRSYLGAAAKGLLEVVAEDLLVFGEASAHLRLEPVGELLVQLGARLLGQRVVRGVADEEMAELEGVLVGEVGGVRPDELLPDEREEMCADLGA